METDKRHLDTLRSPVAFFLLAVLFSCSIAAHLVIHSSQGASNNNNNNTIEIGFLEEAYVYCWEGDKEHVDRLVVWQTSDNQTIGTFMQGRRAFTTGCRAHLPHCILSFIDFTGDMAGEYRCTSLRPGTPPITSSVIIKGLTSTATVTVGRCLSFPREGNVCLEREIVVECLSVNESKS